MERVPVVLWMSMLGNVLDCNIIISRERPCGIVGNVLDCDIIGSREKPYGIVGNVLDFDIIGCEFKLQSYYVPF